MANELHPKAAELRLPRLSKPGKCFLGPEPVGCFNTGMRPRIYRDLNGYYVGYEVEIESLQRDRWRAEARRQKPPVSRKRMGGFGAKYFKSATPARRKFVEMISKRLYENDELRAEYRKAQEDARSADPSTAIAGALRLGGF